MTEEEIKELKANKEMLGKSLASLHFKVAQARKALRNYEKEYLTLLNHYDDLDMRLTKIDGRYKKIPSKTRKPEPSIVSMSQEQVLRIAEKLGVHVTVKDFEDIDELEGGDLVIE